MYGVLLFLAGFSASLRWLSASFCSNDLDRVRAGDGWGRENLPRGSEGASEEEIYFCIYLGMGAAYGFGLDLANGNSFELFNAGAFEDFRDDIVSMPLAAIRDDTIPLSERVHSNRWPLQQRDRNPSASSYAHSHASQRSTAPLRIALSTSRPPSSHERQKPSPVLCIQRLYMLPALSSNILTYPFPLARSLTHSPTDHPFRPLTHSPTAARRSMIDGVLPGRAYTEYVNLPRASIQSVHTCTAPIHHYPSHALVLSVLRHSMPFSSLCHDDPGVPRKMRGDRKRLHGCSL